MILRKRRRRVQPIVDLSDETSRDEVVEFEPDSAEEESSDSPEPRRPRRIITTRKSIILPNDPQSGLSESWSKKYSDKYSTIGTAISHKKSKDVKQWLINALAGKGPRLLVLGGPPGSGKSFAVRLLCHEQGCHIREWSAPVIETRGILRSLISDFESFIVGAQYQALVEEDTEENETQKQYVILVKDFPVYITDSREHTQTLRKIFTNVAKLAKHPTVLILSDTDKGVAQMARHLIGLDLLDSSLVETIKINCVSDTMMKRRLIDISALERLSISDNTLENIIASSRGDLRSALNSLQFTTSSGSYQTEQSLRHAVREKRNQKRAKREKSVPVSFVRQIGRDSTLSTYHAIAKVLNNKRSKDGSSIYSAEDILENSGSDPSSFLSFLHRNYLSFFGNVNDIPPALECLSDSDVFLPWKQDEKIWRDLTECAGSLAIRGFLEHNNSPIRTGWRPIHGSDSWGIENERQDYITAACHQFEQRISPTVYHTSHACETFAYAEIISQTKVKQWSLDGDHIDGETNSLMTANKFVIDDTNKSMKKLNRSKDSYSVTVAQQWKEEITNSEEIEEWDDSD